MSTADLPGTELACAASVFVEGFSFTRSLTHPYPFASVGPMWVLRDAPRLRSEDLRREEWVACDLAPEVVDRTVREGRRGRCCVSVLESVGRNEAALRAAYRELGYRLQCTEPVMMHSLAPLPRASSPAVVRRVLDVATADALARVARSRQILPEHLVADAPIRQYVAELGGAIAGWVRSVTCAKGNWVSNLFVVPALRRRGIGRALLCALLRDDRAQRAPCSVLTASHAGARLYATVGYRTVGTLFLFTPRR
jgi:GNAT superfamily N-acetyltransferase